jgi:hypothetical protein
MATEILCIESSVYRGRLPLQPGFLTSKKGIDLGPMSHTDLRSYARRFPT